MISNNFVIKSVQRGHALIQAAGRGAATWKQCDWSWFVLIIKCLLNLMDSTDLSVGYFTCICLHSIFN